MLPQGLSKLFAALRTENSLVSDAKSNLKAHLNGIEKTGISVYLGANGKAETGAAAAGATRLYWWSNTEIDGKHTPKLIKADDMNAIKQKIEMQSGFYDFCAKVFEYSGGKLNAEAMAAIASTSSDNEDVPVLRTGFMVKADTPQDFEDGLKIMREKESALSARPINLVIPENAKGFDLKLHDNRHEL